MCMCFQPLHKLTSSILTNTRAYSNWFPQIGTPMSDVCVAVCVQAEAIDVASLVKGSPLIVMDRAIL